MSLTPQQRKALHLYCEQLAEAFSDAGIGMKQVFEVMTVDIPWSKERVKDCLWRKIQIAMFDIESTEDLEPKQVDHVYEVLNKHIGEHWGIHVPFPSEETK